MNSIFENISDLIFVVDYNGGILFQSASVKLVLGYSEDELSGQKIFSFINQEDSQALKYAFRQVQLKEGVGKRVEFNIQSKFGNIVCLEAEANNQLNNPDVEAIIITCRIITERKKNELALIQKSRLLEAIAKSSAFFVSDIEWVEILRNVCDQISPLLDIDRAYFFESISNPVKGKLVFKQIVEWVKDSVESQMNNAELQAFDLSEYDELLKCLLKNDLFITNVEDIISIKLKEHLSIQNIASLVVMPVLVRGKLRGFLGFDACYKKRIWTSDEIATLKLLVSVMAASLEARLFKEELLLNNKRYQYIAQATNDILWEYNPDGQVTKYWGSGFQQIFGDQSMSIERSKEERDSLIHSNDRKRVILSFDSFIQTSGEFWEETYLYKGIDGSYIYILDRAMSLKNSAGTIQSVIGSMRNITFIKEQESQRNFLLFVTNCFKLNSTTRDSLKCIIEKSAKLMGAEYTEAWEVDFSGESLLYKAKWGRDGKRVFKNAFVISRMSQEGGLISECWNREMVLWEPGLKQSKFLVEKEAGEAGFVAMLCVPLVYKSEVVAIFTFYFSSSHQFSEKYISFFHDLSGQLGEMLVQKQLENQLSTFFDHSPALLCITSGAKFVKVNRSFSKLLGYSEAELLERSFYDFLHPEDKLHNAISTEMAPDIRMLQRFQNRYLSKDGRVIWLEWTSIFSDDNNLSYSIAYDITKERELEKQLEKERRDRVNEVAEAAILAQEHEKEELAKELHDNVNQILATSLMYLSLIRITDAKQSDNLSQAISAVRESIKEIRQLSHALSSANLNDHDLHFALINLFAVIKESKGIEVRHEIDMFLSGNLSHKLKVNIYRIIQEQFNNIYKHAHADFVIIELFSENGWVILRIKDNGVGKDAEKFESGIGLLNIRSRVDLFNGKLKVNTAIDKGFELIAYFIDRSS